MKSAYAAILLATLSACGGTSIDAPVATPVVSSGGSAPTASRTANAATTAAALSTPTTTIPQVDATLVITGDASFAGLLNSVRADNGAAPVSYNAQLDLAAQRHAQDMLDNNYFSHTGLDGSTIGTRVRDTGYNFRAVGENIAAGYQTEDSVLDGWVNSPGHQRNNISPNFDEFGLGIARDGRDTRWVLVLGSEQ